MEDSKAVIPADLGARLPVKINTLQDLATIGQILVGSGYFKDVSDKTQAVTKILAGAEIGLGPVASLTNIYIVEGKPSFSSNLIAAQIKRHPDYDYRVNTLTDTGCEVTILQRTHEGLRDGMEPIGSYSFMEADAKRAGLLDKKNWKTYPRSMYFARAISGAARTFCPDVFQAVTPYTPEELAPDVITVDADGQVIDAPATPSTPVKEEPAEVVHGMDKDVEYKAPPKQEPAVVLPWMNEKMSVAENKNALYAIAVAEWGYEDVSAVRETIIEANRWTGDPPIPNLKILNEIAQYLADKAPKK